VRKYSDLPATRFVWVAVTLFSPSVALAYVGPGAGISAIGSVIALVGALLMAIIGFVWYPVKKMLRAKAHAADEADAEAEAEEETLAAARGVEKSPAEKG
jgi:hypothetical protein